MFLYICKCCEIKRINEAVKNNPDKFPQRFSFVLDKDEDKNLRSKFSTSSLEINYCGRRYRKYDLRNKRKTSNVRFIFSKIISLF